MTDLSLWYHTGRNSGRGHLNVIGVNCSSWWHSNVDRERGVKPHQIWPARVAPWYSYPLFKHSGTKTEVKSWTGYILLFWLIESASASLSVSGDQSETITDSQKLGTCLHFSAFSLSSQAFVCQRHPGREAGLGRTGPPFHSTTLVCQWNQTGPHCSKLLFSSVEASVTRTDLKSHSLL